MGQRPSQRIDVAKKVTYNALYRLKKQVELSFNHHHITNNFVAF